MRDELGRARRRGAHVLMPEEVPSPMDLNPTLEVSAAIIADCVRLAGRDRPWPTGQDQESTTFDEGLRQIALGAGRKPRLETA